MKRSREATSRWAEKQTLRAHLNALQPATHARADDLHGIHSPAFGGDGASVSRRRPKFSASLRLLPGAAGGPLFAVERLLERRLPCRRAGWQKTSQHFHGGRLAGAVRRRVSKELTRSLWRSTLMLALFVLWLFLATILEVWTWALLYLALDAVTTLDEAAYFSMETFTTLGYGDITLDKNWRLLSSFEGANGLLMFGWSTALVFAAIQWIYRTRTRAPS